MDITNVSALIAAIGALVVIVNLLTEVIKKSTGISCPQTLLWCCCQRALLWPLARPMRRLP